MGYHLPVLFVFVVEVLSVNNNNNIMQIINDISLQKVNTSFVF